MHTFSSFEKMTDARKVVSINTSVAGSFIDIFFSFLRFVF